MEKQNTPRNNITMEIITIPNPYKKYYLVNYKVKVMMKDKKGRWFPITIEGRPVKTTKKKLDENVKKDANILVEQFERDSKVEVKDVVIEIGKKTLWKKGKGWIGIKYKAVSNMKLDKGGITPDEEWNGDNETCIPDYLAYKYKGMNRIKKLLPADNLEKCMKNLYEFFDIDMNSYDGLTLEDLKRFCNHYDITLLVIDNDDECLMYEKSKNGHLPAMIIYVANNHIYPVDNKKEREKLINKYRVANKKIVSDDVEDKVVVKDEKLIVHNDTDIENNDWAFNTIKELNTMPSKLKVSGNTLTAFEIGDKKYITSAVDNDIVEYIERKGLVYQGQTINEISSDYLRKANIRKSVFNEEVDAVMNKKGVKYRTHYGVCGLMDCDESEFNDAIERGEFTCIDIVKCYTSCLFEIKNWLCYDINDNWEFFDGRLKFGLYYVETDDLTILHQSNIYSNSIIEYALSFGIEMKIIKQLIPKKKYTDEEKIDLTDILKTINKDAGALKKKIFNTLTGLFGKTEQKKYYVSMDTDLNVVYNKIGSKAVKDDLVFKTFSSGEKDYHLFGHITTRKLFETWLPMYIQILDLSNMKLHQLSTKMGGEVVYRKTDMVVCKGGVIPELSEVIGGYRIEKKEVWRFTPMDMERGVKIKYTERYWNTSPLKDSSAKDDIIKSVIENGGGLICGRAGTGKSYCIQDVGDEFVRMAPTNIAARNIDGLTIHKTLGINMKGKVCGKLVNKLSKYKGVIIDEAGMICQAIWKQLYFVKKKFPQLIFIILGDYRQLEPVEPTLIESIDVFNTSVIKYLCNNFMVELNVMKRYDLRLWNYLEDGYERNLWEGLPLTKIDMELMINNKNISYYNATRCWINKICMEYAIGFTPYIILDNIIEDCSVLEQKTYIYNGLPVMAIKNCQDLELVNGEKFILINYTDETFTLQGYTDITLPIEDFAEYFVVNYCSTTHKCQGETYAEKVILWDWDRMKRNKKIAYTACSRSVNYNNLLVGMV
jgi:hypothetical protein